MIVRSSRLALALLAGAGLAAQSLPGEVFAEQKVSDTVGGLVASLPDGAQFGHSVSRAGDIDNDGIEDLVVGASETGFGSPGGGCAIVLFMNADGTVKDEQIIAEGVGGFALPTFPVENFGQTVEGIGDLDADGVEDIVVGAPGDQTGGVDHGAIYIVRLFADGTVKAAIKHAAGVAGPLLDADGAFGISIAHLGDIDDDGRPDIAVGAFTADDQQALTTASGAVWVLRLNSNGTIKGAEQINASLGGAFAGPLDTNDLFGTSCEGIGDFDGDGIEDLAVGAQGDDDGETDAGAVWLLWLDTDGKVGKAMKISATSGGFKGSLDPSDDFGRSLALLAGFGPKELVVLAVGASGDGDNGVNRGAVWQLSVDPFEQEVVGHIKIHGSSGGFGGTLDDNDAFGNSVTAWSSPDGPVGQDDLVVGAVGDDDGGSSNTGAIWVLSLQDGAGQPPFTPVNSLTGRPGRSALVIPGAPGPPDEFDEPVVVVPKAAEDVVHIELSEAQADGSAIFFPVGDYSVGLGPSQAATADINDDGNTDIVAANKTGGSFSYLEGLGDGDFLPHDETDLPFDDQPVALGIADMDGDGADDVVIAGDVGVTVFLGDGAGNFTSQSFVPVALLTDLYLATVDTAADIDVVAVSGAVAGGPGLETGFATVLKNDGDGNLSAFGTFASAQAIASVLLGDFDHDTDNDALLAVHQLDDGPAGEPQGSLDLWLNGGAGGFSASGLFAGFETPNEGGTHPTYGALGDVDGDTWLDAVYTSSDNLAFAAGTFGDEQPPLVVTVLLNQQDGSFTPSTVPTAYTGKGVAPMLQDIVPLPPDGDLDAVLIWFADTTAGQAGGLDELETYIGLLAGDGTGDFFDPAPNQFVSGDEPGGPATGDVNGDDPVEGAAGGPDVLVPNLADNSIAVLLGDGAGGLGVGALIPDVDDLDPGSLPPGLWVGGPRALALGHLDAGPTLDLAAYNAWEDTSPVLPDATVFASVSLYTGDGAGAFTKVQYLPLVRGGDIALGDITLDGLDDLVVTQRVGDGASDTLDVFPGLGTGAVNTTPQDYSPPANQTFTGGLVVTDVNGDADTDVLTTTRSLIGGLGRVVLYRNSGTGTLLAPSATSLGEPWTGVRSLDMGDVTGDGLSDALVGVGDGRLLVAEKNGPMSFEPLAVIGPAGTLAGGALRAGDLDGDLLADLVTASPPDETGDDDQAFVRTAYAEGAGVFVLDTVGGVSSYGVFGAIRPALADMDNDGADDLVLSHGSSDSVSVVLNELAAWERYGAGKPGKGGITPALNGTGFTTPGALITLRATDGVGGAPALLWIGVGKVPAGSFHVQIVLLSLLLNLGGTPGAAGQGGFVLPALLPDDASLVGVELALQLLVSDANAGLPAPTKVATSNGLAFTFVE